MQRTEQLTREPRCLTEIQYESQTHTSRSLHRCLTNPLTLRRPASAPSVRDSRTLSAIITRARNPLCILSRALPSEYMNFRTCVSFVHAKNRSLQRNLHAHRLRAHFLSIEVHLLFSRKSSHMPLTSCRLFSLYYNTYSHFFPLHSPFSH
jgi:hypothetical protein